MAVLRIEVKVDERLIELFEFNTVGNGDAVMRYWEFMRAVKAQLSNWSFKHIFG